MTAYTHKFLIKRKVRTYAIGDRFSAAEIARRIETEDGIIIPLQVVSIIFRGANYVECDTRIPGTTAHYWRRLH